MARHLQGPQKAGLQPGDTQDLVLSQDVLPALSTTTRVLLGLMKIFKIYPKVEFFTKSKCPSLSVLVIQGSLMPWSLQKEFCPGENRRLKCG